MAGQAWVPNTFPSPYLNSELKPNQLSLILENEFLKWFLDLKQVMTPLFYFKSPHFPRYLICHEI